MLDKEYEFLGQNQDEKVLLVLRTHWLFFIVPILKVLGLVIIFLLTLYFFGASKTTSYITFILVVLVLYIIFINIFRWYNTVYLLTTHRIVCVYQISLFNRVVSEATLSNILFISHKIQGPLSTLFNVGSIHIRASGVTEEEIILQGIPDPYSVQQEIVANQKKHFDTEKGDLNYHQKKEGQDFWQADKTKRIIR